MSFNLPQSIIKNNQNLNQSTKINYYHNNLNNNYFSFGEAGVQNTVVTMINTSKNKFQNFQNPSNAKQMLYPNKNKIDINKNMPINKYMTSNKINQPQINKYNITNQLNNYINNNINITKTQVFQTNGVNKVYPSKNYSKVNSFNKQQQQINNNDINNIKHKVSQNIDNNLDFQDYDKINSKNYQTQKKNNTNIINKPESQKQLKESQNLQGYSFARYKKPALTGLKNLGDTSYLNAVLQLICSIRNVASYFINPKNGDFFKKNIVKYPLSYVMHRLCTHLYPYPEKSEREIYTPDSIMEVLGTLNIVYRDYSKRKPIDFIVFFFSILHKELNAKKNKNYSQNNFKNYQSDKNKVIQYGSVEFINNNSIISNYFTWFSLKRIQCNKCSDKIYSFQNFQTFDLNISLVAKFKKTQNLKLLDCIEFNQLNFLKNNIFCENCKSYNRVTECKKIYTSPNYFIFLLDIKENKNINFILEQKINLEKYIESKNQIPTSYELNGIVFFDKNKNKYNALCVSPIDKNWYLYDDENVQMLNISIFLNLINNNNNGTYRLCILLYNGIPKN